MLGVLPVVASHLVVEAGHLPAVGNPRRAVAAAAGRKPQQVAVGAAPGRPTVALGLRPGEMGLRSRAMGHGAASRWRRPTLQAGEGVRLTAG